MLQPHLGAKGSFTFASPFNNIISTHQELTVTSSRFIRDLENNNQDPLRTVYEVAGLTKEDMIIDSNENIPIISLEGTGHGTISIPARYILSIPKINGIRYQEKVVIVNVGLLPIDTDMSILLSTIDSNVQAVVGAIPTIDLVPTSAIVKVEYNDHELLELKRSNSQVTNKSYQTKYLETLESLNKKENIISKLESHIKTIHSP